MHEKSTLNAIWIMFRNLTYLLSGPPILVPLENKVINKQVGVVALSSKNHEFVDFDVPNSDF